MSLATAAQRAAKRLRIFRSIANDAADMDSALPMEMTA